MLRNIIPITLIAMLGFGTAAFAETEMRTVAKVDDLCGTPTMADGATLYFNDEDDAERLHCFKPGDEVSITYHRIGTKLEADAISPVNVSYTVEEAPIGHEHTHLD